MGCCISERKKENITHNEYKKDEEDNLYDSDVPEKDETFKKHSFIDSIDPKMSEINEIIKRRTTNIPKISTIRTIFSHISGQSQSVKFKQTIEKEILSRNIEERIKIVIKLSNLDFVFENFYSQYHSTFNPIIKISDGRITREYKNLTEKKATNISNKEESLKLMKAPQNSSKIVYELKSNPNNSLTHVDGEVVNLINYSAEMNTSIGGLSTDYDAGITLAFEDNINSNEFLINMNYSKEIHNWITFKLYNEITYFINTVEMPLAEGYLPLNMILIKQVNKKSAFSIKIPLINPVDDEVIAYLNVTIENNTDYTILKPIAENIAKSKILNFYGSRNVLNLNDLDPFLLDEYFNPNITKISLNTNEELNKGIYEGLLKILESSNYNEISNFILEEKEKKMPYDWEVYHHANYYTFLTIVNEIFGKSVKYRESNSVKMTKQIIASGERFFNIRNFQPDFEVNNSENNCLIVNNLLNLFVTFYKEKIHEKSYCDNELAELFSIQNFFKAFGESYYKIIEKLTKRDFSYENGADTNMNLEDTGKKQILDKLKNNLILNNRLIKFDSTDHLNYILHKSIQRNFLFLTNSIFETYLKQGTHPKKSLIFTTKKNFLQKEIQTLKQKLKEYFLLSGNLLKDPNFIFSVLKILINFVKFIKLFCYLNSFSHTNVYIDSLLLKDNTLTMWILSVFNEGITNPRMFPMFLEFVHEITEEMKGIQFFHFKKYFELPLFTMNFTHYLRENTKNDIVIHFIVKIFLKFATYAYPEELQYLDFISLNCIEITLLSINCLNIFLTISKEDKFAIYSQKLRKVPEINTIKLYSSKRLVTKFFFSYFYIQILGNILAVFSKLFVNNFQFYQVFQTTNKIRILKSLLKYIAAFVFLDIEYGNKENIFGQDLSLALENKIIYYDFFEKSLHYLKSFVSVIRNVKTLNLKIKSMLKEVVEDISFNQTFDENELWSDFLFNLTKKIENYSLGDRFLKTKRKIEKTVDEIIEIVENDGKKQVNIFEDMI